MATTKKSAKSSGEGSINAVVFVPSGPTPRNQILKTAIVAVRDKIPVAYTLLPEIDSVSDVKTVDGTKGREYTIKVNYSTDATDAPPVDVDAEIEKLTVPTLPDYHAAVTATESGGPSDGPGDK